MKKAHFALIGIICVLMVATTSLQVAYAQTAPVPFPPCNKVPSYYLKGTQIKPWPSPTQDVPRKGFSFVKADWTTHPWSTTPEAYKKQFLSYGTRHDLYIDGKKQFLLMDVCYDATGSIYGQADALWKFSYMQYFPYQWKGSHIFRMDALFNGAPVTSSTSTVTFT